MSEGSEHELDWLLHKLSASVNGVQNAVILSPDGLPLGRSAELNPADANTLAALAAGAQALAHATSRKFESGDVVQTTIEMDTAILFITPTGRGTCVALLADADADHGQIAYELAILVTRVGQHMIADPRFPVRDTV
jgi:predicted regulator of Ras-like GTPase activity (Roadblock/LC7/MglB family)